MTAHPDLTPEQANITDEELAARVRREIWRVTSDNDECAEAERALARLIAALRASRAERDRWWKRAFQAQTETERLRAEVDALRAAVRQALTERDALRQDAVRLSRTMLGAPVQLPPLSDDEA